MNLDRGDIILARFPHVAGGRGKKRPVVIVQADGYNRRLRHVVVAEVTGNLAEAADPATLLIEVSTPEGAATGLKRDSLVNCLFLQTLSEDRANQIIGKISASMLVKLDHCLKAALGIS
jgi:mRNA interferase MazF